MSEKPEFPKNLFVLCDDSDAEPYYMVVDEEELKEKDREWVAIYTLGGVMEVKVDVTLLTGREGDM